MTVLKGVTVALLTPSNDDGGVDHASLERLTRSVLAGGVTGLSPLGSTGEGFSLPLYNRLEVVQTVARVVPRGTPVIPGVFAHNPSQAIDEIAAYARSGATQVLIAPPSYYPLDAAELASYLLRVADASALPLVIYNIPPFTKVQIVPQVIAAIASHRNIIGIKDSGRDFGYMLDVLDTVAKAGLTAEDFAVVVGTDSMFVGCLIAGASGSICASANVVPELPVGIFDAVARGDLDEARALEVRLREVLAIVRVSAPAGVKSAAAALGLCRPQMFSPRTGLDAAVTDRIGHALAELGIAPAPSLA